MVGAGLDGSRELRVVLLELAALFVVKQTLAFVFESMSRIAPETDPAGGEIG